jgi:3-phosphoshikimate 1-carboxyvinyltransferase
MHERPQAALFQALRELGYRVDSPNDKLPAVLFAGSSRGHETHTNDESQSLLTSPATTKKARVSVEESSQFASALLLSAERGGWQIEVTGENAEESPYVAMTTEMIKVFPKRGGKFEIEPDASSGSYFWAVGLVATLVPNSSDERNGPFVTTWHPTSSIRLQVNVRNWPRSQWQIDAEFPSFLGFLTDHQPMSTEHLTLAEKQYAERFGATWREQRKREYEEWEAKQVVKEISRADDLGDSIMTAIVTTSLGSRFLRFTDLGRLRVQECERVVALRTELTKCGAKVIETGDTLEVFPSKLHGAEIETYNDHRMAMCFAVLGLKVPGIKLRSPSCVKKTFPNFFQKLAADPPHGLGVTILDGHTGRKLSQDELFAE